MLRIILRPTTPWRALQRSSSVDTTCLNDDISHIELHSTHQSRCQVLELANQLNSNVTLPPPGSFLPSNWVIRNAMEIYFETCQVNDKVRNRAPSPSPKSSPSSFARCSRYTSPLSPSFGTMIYAINRVGMSVKMKIFDGGGSEKSRSSQDSRDEAVHVL